MLSSSKTVSDSNGFLIFTKNILRKLNFYQFLPPVFLGNELKFDKSKYLIVITLYENFVKFFVLQRTIKDSRIIIECKI